MVKVLNRKGQIKEITNSQYNTKMAMSQAYISSPYLSKKKARRLALNLFD